MFQVEQQPVEAETCGDFDGGGGSQIQKSSSHDLTAKPLPVNPLHHWFTPVESCRLSHAGGNFGSAPEDLQLPDGPRYIKMTGHILSWLSA
jgi:hypothetical protein